MLSASSSKLLSLPTNVFHEHVLSRVRSLKHVSLLLRVSKTVRALVASCGALVLEVLWHTHILKCRGAELGEAVASWLKAVPGIQTLTLSELSYQGIGDEGAKALAAGLVSVPGLQTLFLFGNNIGDEGAKALASGLVYVPGLQTLKLPDNNIGAEGGKALAAGLVSVP